MKRTLLCFRLVEDPDLQLPFLLPEDGYSCDIVKGVSNGLADFLDAISQSGTSFFVPTLSCPFLSAAIERYQIAGVCWWFVNQHSKGLWTAYMGEGPTDVNEVKLQSQRSSLQSQLSVAAQGRAVLMPR